MLYWNKYPFIRISLFLSLGIIQSYYFPLPLEVAGLGLAISLLLFIGLSIHLKKSGFRKLNLLLGITLSVMLCFSGSILLSLERLQSEKKRITLPSNSIEVFVAEIKKEQGATEKSKKWITRIFQTKDKHHWHQSKEKILAYFPKDSDLEPGDVIICNGRLHEINAPIVSHAFNYKEYMHRRAVRYVSYISNEQYTAIDNYPPALPLRISYRSRLNISSLITTHFTNKRTQGILLALLTGNRANIDKETSATFKHTGIIHILAVSGLHVGIIFLLLSIILKPLKRIRGGKWIQFILMVLSLAMFALMTGLSPSVNRAVLMLIIIQLGNSLNRQSSILNNIFLSMFILLLVNPFYIFEVGFQLSYAAVLGIVLLYPMFNDIYKPSNRVIRKIYQLLLVSLSAQLATLPFILYYFHQFPTYFLFSNLLAIPYAFFMVTSGILFLVLSFFQPLSGFMVLLINNVSDLFLWAIGFMENWPNALVFPISINLLQAFVMGLGITAFYKMIIERKKALLKTLLLFSLLFVTVDLVSKWEAAHRLDLIEYRLPGKQGCFELIDGFQSSMIVDKLSPENVKNIKFHTGNLCIKKRHIPEFISIESFIKRFHVKEEGKLYLLNWADKVYVINKNDLSIKEQINIHEM